MLRQIYGRLTLISMLLMVVAIVAIGLSLRRQRLDTIADATRSIGNVATMVAEQASHSVQSIDIVLQEVVERAAVRLPDDPDAFDDPRMNHFLSERQLQLPQADVVSIANRNGDIVASTRGPSAPRMNVADRDFFRHHMSTRDSGLHITEPLVGKQSGLETIFFSRRIEAADGSLKGVAIVGVQPDFFLRTGNVISSIPGQSLVLLNSEGVVYLRKPDPLNRTGTRMPLPQEWRALMAQGGGVYRSDGIYSSTPRWVAVRPLKQYRLVVNVSVVEAVALEGFVQRAWLIISVALGSMLCFGLMLRQLLQQFRKAIDSDRALRERESRLAYVAEHDGLTGLANRSAFLDALEAASSAHQREGVGLCVLLIDLDQFKGINDCYGHRIGDDLLLSFALMLQRATGPTDLVARLGGDEFAIIRKGPLACQHHVIPLLERIVAEARQPFAIEDNLLTIGASIGVAFGDDCDGGPEELLRNADLALYQAKADGRSCFRIFESMMQSKIIAQLELTNDFREALGGDAIVLEYQPIFNILTGDVSGMEALARWRHPARGIISPNVFVPLAEKAGLIGRLGCLVLDRACRDAALWPAHVRVAVNISATQVSHGDLVRIVREALAASGLDPRRLEIEITESAIMGDDDRSLKTLRELRAMGVGIALDDFGTGFSSLSYLSRFPVDKIKIDKSFIDRIETDRSSAAIVPATANIARALDIRTTAEGVEREDQMQMLRIAGVDEAQGFLLGKPLPISQWTFTGRTVIVAKQERLAAAA